MRLLYKYKSKYEFEYEYEWIVEWAWQIYKQLSMS